MSDPVMAADGHTYERSAIERWLATKSTSPMTGEALEHICLFPSHILRRQIREWREAHPGRRKELHATEGAVEVRRARRNPGKPPPTSALDFSLRTKTAARTRAAVVRPS
ncbi:hypothetical protein EMIHUDRAFT_221293 [Emiliania huxleyi CCMP1516]|uniref:U-box domain-containing protein n=2 Tax=Emiliania huxleyi TaxID=2903 RepID=A0A0D3HYX4_EMIH1|nr:hypothetical protein EMIHUDRAFT_221293 [Emiliania huxleyi CCMP1516]EOD04209.1 hypothetical protein EMIHUDRAFT_221293 [Emiliania huxleyi CCMP1516]|eukprot:XP_005756638.1 hypothetical protein EMIHUDRAFT_221293 [Emiliania huxleyi CCMP1516]